jgi:hypothetical protein
MIVVVVLVLAGLAVLGAVVVLAMGRGGELTPPSPDHPPLDDQPFPGADPRPFRLPRALWGYQVEIADHTIGRLRHALWEREAQVAALEHRLHDLQRRLDARESPLERHDALEGRWAPVDFAKNGKAEADPSEAAPPPVDDRPDNGRIGNDQEEEARP